VVAEACSISAALAWAIGIMLAKRPRDRAAAEQLHKAPAAHVRLCSLNTARTHRITSIARSIISVSLDCGLGHHGAGGIVVGCCRVRPAGTLICWQRSHSHCALVIEACPLSRGCQTS